MLRGPLLYARNADTRRRHLAPTILAVRLRCPCSLYYLDTVYLDDDHPDAPSARVTLVVVALGRTRRLADCLAALVAHQSHAPFTIVCVINPQQVVDDTRLIDLVASYEIHTIEPTINVGWAGGLHVGRGAVTTELFAWVQDDMIVCEGWLDALVDAADAHPEVAAFGSLKVDEAGTVERYNGGWCVPDDLLAWAPTDDSHLHRPRGVTRRDWVSSRGMLVRTRAWDDVGGADPSLFPLTFVDLDFTSHLRAHGWGVAIASEATLVHPGNQSAPGLLREYLGERLVPRVHKRWSGVVARLADGAARSIAHDCTRDRSQGIEHWCALEATDIVVQFGRWAENRRHEHTSELAARVNELNIGMSIALEQLASERATQAAQAAATAAYSDDAAARAELAAMRATLSWRLTAPLRRARAWQRRHDS